MTFARTITALGAALAAAILVAAAPAPPVKSQTQIVAAAMSGRVLTRSELVRIYSGRTWHWKNGAAYLGPNRKFFAWTKTGAERAYGEGSWSVSNNGQLCLRAEWHSLSESTAAFSCYIHRRSDAIYQRALPHGDWFVFSHIPQQSTDEIARLERGNHVSGDFAITKRYVIAHTRAGRRNTP